MAVEREVGFAPASPVTRTATIIDGRYKLRSDGN